MKQRTIILAIFITVIALKLQAQQPVSSTFELRYFTNDTLANGETDFKGKTEWMNTDQRINFLSRYAKVASLFFNNPDFNKKIVANSDVDSLLSKIKPQPTTSIRKTTD